jgi:hypothetical protein
MKTDLQVEQPRAFAAYNTAKLLGGTTAALAAWVAYMLADTWQLAWAGGTAAVVFLFIRQAYWTPAYVAWHKHDPEKPDAPSVPGAQQPAQA